MERGNFNDKQLESALEQVRANKEDAARFAADPKGYLESKGVKTEGLKFGAAELSEAELEAVAGGAAGADAPTVCHSVGCIFCSSVGDTIQAA